MADLASYQQCWALQLNDDPTLRTGSATTLIDMPMFTDAGQVKGSRETQDIETETCTRGVRYSFQSSRNQEAQSIRVPVFPETAALLLKAATDTQGGGVGAPPNFHHLRRMWGTQAESGMEFDSPFVDGSLPYHYGAEYYGTIFDTMSFAVDRSNPGAVELELGCFINQDVPITVDPNITHVWPARNPYATINVFVELLFADDETALAAMPWTGDNPDVRSLTLNYQNNLELDLYRPNADEHLDGSWTKVQALLPTLTFDFNKALAYSDYEDLQRGRTSKLCKIRLMGYHPQANGATTTTTDLTAGGTSVAMSVADETGFAVGDKIIVLDPTNDNQTVGEVEATAANSITIDVVDADIDATTAAAQVFNTAWQIKVEKGEVTMEPNQSEGAIRTVSGQINARVDPNQQTLLTVDAYNDDNA